MSKRRAPRNPVLAPSSCPRCGRGHPAPLTLRELVNRLEELEAKLAPTQPPTELEASVHHEYERVQLTVAVAIARDQVGWIVDAIAGYCHECSPTTITLRAQSAAFRSTPELADAMAWLERRNNPKD